MARFSERMGVLPVRDAIQIDSVDDALRVSLWNAVGGFFFRNLGDYSKLSQDKAADKLLAQLWVNLFKRPLDERPPKWGDAKEAIKRFLFTCEWYEVYEFVEFVAQVYTHPDVSTAFIEECNCILRREMSGYRFVNKELVRVTSDEEIVAIEEALKAAGPLQPVRDHLQRGLSLLSDRKDPDYRNSIKESISAVEALCKLMAGDPKATLGSSLNAIQASGKVDIHPSLKEALHKLYGYTSDADGIRHALKDAPTLDYEDAMFMLTTCSGFISYLLAKGRKAGIQL